MSYRASRSIIHRIEHATITAYGDSQKRTILVAISGGADSAAALIALKDRASMHSWDLHAAYLDHCIADSDVRSDFFNSAESISRQLDVPFHSAVVDVPDLVADFGGNIEEIARIQRYRFLSVTAADVGAGCVITGHTQDDQAETVLLHLLRGSGLDGLTGMAMMGRMPVDCERDFSNQPLLIRPLLSIRRSQTREFCRDFSISFIDDPANEDISFLRNRLRLEIIPKLEEINPGVVERLASLAENLSTDRNLLDSLTDEVAVTLIRDHRMEDRGLLISRRALRREPIAIQIRIIRRCLKLIGGAVPSAERTQALIRLLELGGHRVECGDGIFAEARGDQMQIKKH